MSARVSAHAPAGAAAVPAHAASSSGAANGSARAAAAQAASRFAADSFTFSDEIEAELKNLEATGQGSAAAAVVAAATQKPVRPHAHAEASASAAATRAAAANPQAYAEAHFNRPFSSTQSDSPTSAANKQRLSIDAVAAERSAHRSAPFSHQRGPSSPSALAHAAAAGVSFSSGRQAASASASSSSAGGAAASSSGSDASRGSFYVDDDSHYFNLGINAFPLLPHNSLHEDEMLAHELQQQRLRRGHGGGGASVRTPGFGRTPRGTPSGPEKAFSPSGRIHSQHLTSILNLPPSHLQNMAGPALGSASSYLPSLASLWTFTTGQQPPEAVSRASDELLSFAEEHAASDFAPFVLPPCPPLDAVEPGLAAAVAGYLRFMQPHADIYRRNHPRSSIAAVAAAHKRAREKRAAQQDTYSDFPSVPENGTAADAEDEAEEEERDGIATEALARDLKDCYASVPAVYFSEEFNLSSLSFWQDQRDVKFVKEQEKQMRDRLSERDKAGAGGSMPTTPGGTPINPYSSFNALASYHSSQHFTLPSLAEQKAAQLRAYQQSQERLAVMAELNKKHHSLQVELSAYLDTVEMTLLQQISHRSWQFFDALTHIKGIQTEISGALKRIAGLRGAVSELKRNLSDAGLAVLQQVRTMDNTRTLIRTLELTASVLRTSPTVQLLLAAGDFAAALQLIHASRQLLAQDLAGLTCLRHVSLKLDEHSKLIGSMMRLELVGVALRGGSFYLADSSVAQSDSSVATASRSSVKSKHAISSSRTLSNEEQERLVPLVSQLLELGALSSAFESYRDELQNILKQRLMDLVADMLAQCGEDHAEAHVASGEEEVGAANSLLNDQPPPAASTPALSKAESTEGAKAIEAAPASSPALEASPPAVATPAPTEPAAPAVPAASTSARPPERRQAVIAMPVASHAQALSPAQGAVPHASNSVSPAAGATAAAGSSNAAAIAPVPSAVIAVAPTASPAVAATAAPSIGSRFSSMPHALFLSLLQPLLSSLMDLLHRFAAVRNVATTVLANSPLPGATKDAVTRDVNAAMLSLIEYTHGKVSKILQTRAGVHADLELKALRHYLDTILAFIQEGERLAGKPCYGLRGTLLMQAKAFLVSFHARSMSTMTQALEEEKWVRVDVPPEIQNMLDAHFVTTTTTTTKKESLPPGASPSPNTTAAPVASPSSAVTASPDPLADPASTSSSSTQASSVSLKPPPTWQSKSWNDAEENDDEQDERKRAAAAASPTAPAPSPSVTAIAEKPAARVLFVARPSVPGSASGPVTFLRFPVVRSLLVLLRLVGQYIECSSQLQVVGSDILNRLAELLQMFNSRSCQLVLGAGAMHISGLKSITASHLALSSQAVGLLVTQIPVLRAVLGARLPPKHHVLLHALDRVARDCQEHQREIGAKLVMIMDELLKAMRSTLEGLPWAQPAVQQSQICTAGAALNASPPPPIASPPPLLSAADLVVVDECVRTLMKQTCSLHRALSDLMLQEQRDAVFRDIGSLFVRHTRDMVAKLSPADGGGAAATRQTVHAKLATNIRHIAARLATCTGVDEKDVQTITAMGQ